jgi:hypothetical protein
MVCFTAFANRGRAGAHRPSARQFGVPRTLKTDLLTQD